MLEASPSEPAAQATIVADARPARGRASAASVSASRWLPAVAVSMAYPFALHGCVAAVHAAQASAGGVRALWSLSVLVMVALTLAPAALSLRALYAIRFDTGASAVAVRRLMHLGVAVPPFYLLCIRVADLGALVGGTASGLIAWWGVWAVLGVLVWNTGRAAAPTAAEAADERAGRLLSTPAGRSRRIHRIAVVAVLATFLVAHLANHLFALWSIPAQQTAMLALRAWYRAIWIEPVILALFVIAALAGLTRLGRLTRSQGDGFRVLQTASGCYLVFFLMSHVWATLGARYQGIDTNWAFASGGEAGLLASDVLAGVLLYYVGSLLAVTVHAGLGLRMVLLSRRVRSAAASRSARLVFASGTALSVLIVAALLGVRLGG
ncbi:MAG TPA: hypothetical protein VHH11_20115 [Gammaproteobacteria bacterium]|nr:hypothetical protein [Gammaproteobacteria bacterium]